MQKIVYEVKAEKFAKNFGKQLLAVLPKMKKAGGLFSDSPYYGLSRKGNPGMHCVRLDALQTENGWVVNEMDFVPSGRGFCAESLPVEARMEFLKTFADWYSSSKYGKILYSVGEKTICLPEIEFFSEKMRELGVDIEPHTLKDGSLTGVNPENVLIDRLFYRSEILSGIGQIDKFSVSTAESWLDSKWFFSLFWDREDPLALGQKTLEFFRRHMPYSISINNLEKEQQFKNFVISSKDSWLVKATDVEEDYSWGARGVVLGNNVTKKQFQDSLSGVGRKEVGANPILQEFHESEDFSDLWNDVVGGKIVSSGAAFGLPSIKKKKASKKVYARVGIFILINAKLNKVFIPPYGEMTLRQDKIAHGSSDAIFLPFKLV